MAESQNQMVDLDDLQMYSEVQTVDPNAEFGGFSLPPEFDSEGKKIKYLCKARFLPGTDGKFIKRSPPPDNKSAPMSQWNLQIAVEYVIEDEGMPWNHTRVRAWPSTRVFAGTSEIDALLKAWAGGNPVGVGLSNGQKAAKAIEKINAELPFRITGHWEAGETATQEEKDAGEYPKSFLKGMRNFPMRKLADGSVAYDELSENPATKRACRTNFRVDAYWPA